MVASEVEVVLGFERVGRAELDSGVMDEPSGKTPGEEREGQYHEICWISTKGYTTALLVCPLLE